jgi:hypothetical protein
MHRQPKTQRIREFVVPGEWVWEAFERMWDGKEYVRVPALGNVPEDAELVGLYTPDSLPHRFVFVFEHPDFPEVPLGATTPRSVGEISCRVVKVQHHE